MKEIKVYIAGKVSKNSVFKQHYWRDEFCEVLSKNSGFKILNLDPTKDREQNSYDENDAELTFGRDSYMIAISDVVIVNLTDDISVGGSQEMLIAKLYNKPLIGLAPKGGKFNLESVELFGKTVKNWVHPFVSVPCDIIAESPEEAAKALEKVTAKGFTPKDISVIDKAIQKYLQNQHKSDAFLQNLKVPS